MGSCPCRLRNWKLLLGKLVVFKRSRHLIQILYEQMFMSLTLLNTLNTCQIKTRFTEPLVVILDGSSFIKWHFWLTCSSTPKRTNMLRVLYCESGMRLLKKKGHMELQIKYNIYTESFINSFFQGWRNKKVKIEGNASKQKIFQSIFFQSMF